MSNALAIASVSALLRDLLNNGLVDASIGDVTVSVQPPDRISTEESSRLWSAFGAHYRPTAAYQASVVLIESRRPTSTALPVRLRQVFVVPWEEPRIERIEAASGPDDPIAAGVDVALLGQRLF